MWYYFNINAAKKKTPKTESLISLVTQTKDCLLISIKMHAIHGNNAQVLSFLVVLLEFGRLPFCRYSCTLCERLPEGFATQCCFLGLVNIFISSTLLF